MPKKIVIISILFFIIVFGFINSSIPSEEDLKPYQTERGRWVFPKPLKVKVEKAEDILDIKIPYLQNIYEYDHQFLFRILYLLPINVVMTEEETSDRIIAFRTSNEYSMISDSLIKQRSELNSERFDDIAQQSLEKWGYDLRLDRKSLTIFPREHQNLTVFNAKIPPFEDEDFTFSKILRHPIIAKISKEHDIDNDCNGLRNLTCKEIYALTDETFFYFKFEGGTLFEYLINACESWMDNFPDYYVSFKCSSYSKDCSYYKNTTDVHAIRLRLIERKEALRELSKYN